MADESYSGWAILELMGHRRLAGYVQEATIAGASFIRIDVPEHASHEDDAEGELALTASQFYSPAAVYCITPTTEEMARTVATRNQPAPVQRWELAPAPVYSGRDPQDEDEELF